MSHFSNQAPEVDNQKAWDWIRPNFVIPELPDYPTSPTSGYVFKHTGDQHYYQWVTDITPNDWVDLGPSSGFYIGNVPTGTSPLQISDTNHSNGTVNLFVVYFTGDDPAPLLMIDQGVMVKKDLIAGGLLDSGQGTLWLNYGLVGRPILSSAPSIQLMSSAADYPSGASFPDPGNDGYEVGQLFNLTSNYGTYVIGKYRWNGSEWIKGDYTAKYDTLFLCQSSLITPAHLDLGNLTVHGYGKIVSPGNTITSLGSISNGTALVLFNSDPHYGILMGVEPSGKGWIQVQRTDNSATAYNLRLQPLGGGVEIGNRDTSGVTLSPSSGALYMSGPNGSGTIGPQNAGYFHFTTDRPQFYFDHQISVNGPMQFYSTGAKLYSNASGVIQIQDSNGSLATLDASNVFADHINSASGAGIYIMDTLKPYSGSAISIGGILSSTTTNGAGMNGWNIILDIANSSHGAIRNPTGNILFGLHSNGNFYWASTDLGTYPMTLDHSGNLSVSGSISTAGAITLGASNYIYFGGADTYLQRQSAGVIGVMNNGSLGTLNASNVFTDHINSATGGGVTLLDHLYSYNAKISSGGVYMDNSWGNLHFVGASGSNNWNVTDNSGNWVFQVWHSGYISAKALTSGALSANSNGTIYTSGSSQRYKTQIEELHNTEWIYNLRPKTFYWNKDQKALRGTAQQIGLIAEEVEPICKQIVNYNNEGLAESLQYEKLTVPMISEMKKLRERIAMLEAETADLRKQLAV